MIWVKHVLGVEEELMCTCRWEGEGGRQGGVGGEREREVVRKQVETG